MSEGLQRSRLLNGGVLAEPMGIEEFFQISDAAVDDRLDDVADEAL